MGVNLGGIPSAAIEKQYMWIGSETGATRQMAVNGFTKNVLFEAMFSVPAGAWDVYITAGGSDYSISHQVGASTAHFYIYCTDDRQLYNQDANSYAVLTHAFHVADITAIKVVAADAGTTYAMFSATEFNRLTTTA